VRMDQQGGLSVRRNPSGGGRSGDATANPGLSLEDPCALRSHGCRRVHRDPWGLSRQDTASDRHGNRRRAPDASWGPVAAVRMRRHSSDGLHNPPRRNGGAEDSVAKLDLVMALCADLGVATRPERVGPGAVVVPLFSWHHSCFDAEPEVAGVPSINRLAIHDYSACRWPPTVPGASVLLGF
jgi:hypothetical protein